MTEEQQPSEKKKLQLTPLKLAVGLAVIVVVVIGVFGGIGWSLGKSMAPTEKAASSNTEATASSSVQENDAQAPTEAQSAEADTAPESTTVPQEASESVQEQEAEPATDNSMAVLYEDDDYIVSLPAEKIEYAKRANSGSLDKNTRWTTFSYNPPGENNGAGLTVTTAMVDASGSTYPNFTKFIGRTSSGAYVYAMEAGGTFFGDAGAGGVVTLK